MWMLEVSAITLSLHLRVPVMQKLKGVLLQVVVPVMT